jgi:hypothetical protein
MLGDVVEDEIDESADSNPNRFANQTCLPRSVTLVVHLVLRQE